MNTKPRKTAANHAPTVVGKTMGVTVAKQQPDTTMTDNNADNDSTETTDNNDTPTVNGVKLDSVVGVANAFSYLDKMYNVGDIALRTSEELVIIQSRGTRFSYMGTLLEAQKQGHINIQSITAGTNHNGCPCLNIDVVGVDE